MPANTRSSKPTRQSSDIAILMNPKRKDPKPVNAARKENHRPVVSTEIIEISSDEDEEPVPPRPAAATSKLQERIRQLERENARITKENEQIKKRQRTDAEELEDQVTCDICSTKMWSPFILPCGHSFCQNDLESWFDAALKQHRNVYPNYDVNHPGVNMYGQPVQRLPLPPYSCPKCRIRVHTKPIQNFALKGFVRVIAGKAGESSPKKPNSAAANVWNRFFPAQ
ncbi:hypothetical protein FB45DRAFT_918605 [Roridomyces roridus]|uniref:RING-type domain-containing protein n=1 Tax=Roridomyces roridus TaxID=1738132 RepID=A0AAD7FMC1_9AGAR|nr:hypothetical protein FB45DRAFT_918605 [Roridomyces roridus]